jgi:hypothetical protein
MECSTKKIKDIISVIQGRTFTECEYDQIVSMLHNRTDFKGGVMPHKSKQAAACPATPTQG